MELFKILNPKFFAILTSKNKDIYVSTLFVIKQLFEEEQTIEKSVLISRLVNNINKEILLSFDTSEEDEIKNKTYIDARNNANYIVRKLEECGWIEQEYNQLSSFKESIVLPPHSIRIINTLHQITKENEIVFTSHIYSVYSNLYNADVNTSEYRFLALQNAITSFEELINTLRILAHDLRRRQRLVSILSTSNEILSEHFDDYTKTILEQIYLPLKTQDSIQRFKGVILEIIFKWMRSSSTLIEIAIYAKERNHLSTLQEAENHVIDLILKIVDQLTEVEKLVDQIDNRHSLYVSAVAEKVKSLLYANQSIRKKLTSLLLVFNSGNPVYQQRLIDHTSSMVNFQRQGYIDSGSMFIRQEATSKEISQLQPVLIEEVDFNNNVGEFVENSLKSPYSSRMVIEYLDTLMENKSTLSLEEWKLKDSSELIKAIVATIRGFDNNTFYTTNFNDNTIISGVYLVPMTTFVRRGKNHGN